MGESIPSDVTLDQFYREVGKKIRSARTGKLTQDALAKSVGLTRTSLTNIEQGRQRLLLHTFTGIAAALQVDAQDLLPESRTMLKNVGVDLSVYKKEEEREFVATVVTSGATYGENQTNRKASGRAAKTKRRKKSAR